MKKQNALVLASSLSIFIMWTQTAHAQGIAEYGSLMGMPKPMGAAHTMSGGMNKLYGAPTKAFDAIGNASSGGSGGSTAARTVNMGTPVSKTAPAKGAKPGAPPNPKAEAIKLGAQAQELLKQAQALEKAQKWDEAEAAYKKSLGIRERYWKDRDPAIPVILNAMANIAIAQEDAEKSRKCTNASLMVIGKLYGPGSPHRIVPLEIQGSLYEAQNDMGRALESYQQCKMLLDRLTAGEKSQYVSNQLADKINQKCVDLLAKVTGKPPEAQEVPKSSENPSK